MINTFFTIISAFFLIVSSGASGQPEISWSSLLNAPSIFPAQFDITMKSSDDSAVLNDLTAILENPDDLRELYRNYMKYYSKNHQDVEKHETTFKAALIRIARHNLEARSGLHSWTRGVNKFSDLTQQELRMSIMGYNASLPLSLLFSKAQFPRGPTVYAGNVVLAADSKDWREEGKVGSVKHQGNCGSCYAFTTVGALETAHAIKNGGDVLDLSEQEVVDCSGNGGCRGGGFPRSYSYMKRGVTTEKAYPYKARQNQCRGRGKAKPAKVASYGQVDRDEAALKEAVSEYGSIAVGVATNEWGDYHEGVFDGNCGNERGHAVQVIGYGNDDGDYWIIKNSWGRDFGDQGYIKIRAGKNLCGIVEDAVYVTAQ